MATFLILLACRSGAPSEASAETSPAEMAAFRAATEELEKRRTALATAMARTASASEKARIRAEAKQAILATLDTAIFPAWMGTPWSMGPTSTASTPHEAGKTVGCSYFVTAALQNAGLHFDSRTRFAQAAALHIQRSLAPADAQLHRFVSIPAADMAEKVAALGDGLYLIGLRNHIGFVRVSGGAATFIHSGPTGPGSVQSEPLAEAPSVIASRPSGYFVTPLFADGDAGGDRLIDHWLSGKKVAFQSLGYP